LPLHKPAMYLHWSRRRHPGCAPWLSDVSRPTTNCRISCLVILAFWQFKARPPRTSSLCRSGWATADSCSLAVMTVGLRVVQRRIRRMCLCYGCRPTLVTPPPQQLLRHLQTHQPKVNGLLLPRYGKMGSGSGVKMLDLPKTIQRSRWPVPTGSCLKLRAIDQCHGEATTLEHLATTSAPQIRDMMHACSPRGID
jgi:hypothetical protein